jgi:cell division cycle 2-like
VTRWYRAPEVCLEDAHYSTKIDVWSAGCVFAEIISKEVLFKSGSELDQFPTILHQLQQDEKLPTEDEWPGFKQLFDRIYPQGLEINTIVSRKKSLGSLENYFRELPPTSQNALVDDELIDLLKSMLEICPSKRPTAA